MVSCIECSKPTNSILFVPLTNLELKAAYFKNNIHVYLFSFPQDSSSSSDESTDEETKVKVKAEDDKTNVLKQPKEENSNSVPIVAKSERNKCQICSGPERCNQQNKPEIFVGCTNCRGNCKLKSEEHLPDSNILIY